MSNQYTWDQVSKIMNLGFGRNTLLQLLRDLQIIDINNIPYQKFMNRDYFIVILKERPFSSTRKDLVTLTTDKGLRYLTAKIKKFLNQPNNSTP